MFHVNIIVCVQCTLFFFVFFFFLSLLACHSWIPLRIKLGYHGEIRIWYLSLVFGRVVKYFWSVLFELQGNNCYSDPLIRSYFLKWWHTWVFSSTHTHTHTQREREKQKEHWSPQPALLRHLTPFLLLVQWRGAITKFESLEPIWRPHLDSYIFLFGIKVFQCCRSW